MKPHLATLSMRRHRLMVACLTLASIGGCGRNALPPLKEQLELRKSTDVGGDLRQRAIAYLKAEFDGGRRVASQHGADRFRRGCSACGSAYQVAALGMVEQICGMT